MLYNEIVSNLYVGQCPRIPADVNLLKEKGIDTVLSLQADKDIVEEGIAWQALVNQYTNNQMLLIRCPIIDFDKDDLVLHLPHAAGLLDIALGAGRSVYVHCTAGKERSPSAAIAWLAWHQGWGLEKALVHVKTARDCKPFEDALSRADTLFLARQRLTA